MNRVLCRLSAWFTLLILAWAQPAIAVDWEYTVRPGDNLWNLSTKYCGTYRLVTRLAEHNGLSDPHRLEPGSRIRIPVDWLIEQPGSAIVRYAAPDAVVRRGEQTLPASPGFTLVMQDVLLAGSRHAGIEFADGSQLVLSPESETRFDVLSAFGDTGMVDARIHLLEGTADHRVRSRGPATHHSITTPVGVAAVRGTEFRVTSTSTDARVATTEGQVEFADQAKKVTPVPRGLGLVADAQGSRTEPLLPEPVWLVDAYGDPASGPVTVPQHATIAWDALSGASGYVATVSDAVSGEVLSSVVVPAAQMTLSHAPGRYTLGVRGRAVSGLDGFVSTLDVVLVPAASSNLRHQSVDTNGNAARVRFEWDPVPGSPGYRLKVAGNAQEFGADVNEPWAELNLAPGHYQWQVMTAGGGASEPVELTLLPAAPDALRTRRTQDGLLVAWQPLAEVEHRVEVSRTANFEAPILMRSSAGQVLVDVQGCSPCYVRVAAVAGDVQSAYAEQQHTDKKKHPWPIYVILGLIGVVAL